ncbi:MAG: HesA/MoeB/ThiF family protein [Candidatus Thermoplasmatota archaeon]|nr:HesA/MoeB/ThiF family protein [Candidatus Thermoplasmatota archaeon]
MKLHRYQRQMLLKELGMRGQQSLSTKHAVVIGSGGLGSHSASILARMGVGYLTLVDDDTVDITNLHRTAVFSEKDVGKPKARILQQKLRNVNRDCEVRAVKRKVTKATILPLVQNADIIVDGTDSLPLRFLINDTAVKQNIPWVYAGVQGTIGMVMGIVPNTTPCLACVSQMISQQTMRTLPVLGSLPGIIASLQCNEIIKILLGKPPAGLLIVDGWRPCCDCIDVQKNPVCPVCGGVTIRKSRQRIH